MKASSATHLYNHAQVSDVHPLRLDDLHDDPVQVGQLRVWCHASGYERRRLQAAARSPTRRELFVVVVYQAESLPPSVRLGAWPRPPLTVCSAPCRAQVQVQVGGSGGLRRDEVVVSGGSGPGGQRGDQAHRAAVGGVGGRGRGSTFITADGGSGQAGGL